jgi:hypothetical protein
MIDHHSEFTSFRKNGLVGVIEKHDMAQSVKMHFSEWWNGEGMDFDFTDKEEKRVALHLSEIQALVTACILGGLVDIESCRNLAHRMERDYRDRERRTEMLRKEYADY